MKPFITLSRLRSAIKEGNVAGVERLLPDFMEKTQDIPEYRDTLMFDVARESLFHPDAVSAKLFALLLDAGLDPNVKRDNPDGGAPYTPVGWTIALHADFEDLPKNMSADLTWLYAVNRESWSSGGASPQVGYHPEVLSVLLRGGADLSISPVANQWTAGVEWHIDKDSVASLFADMARVNGNPDLRIPCEAGSPAKPSRPVF